MLCDKVLERTDLGTMSNLNRTLDGHHHLFAGFFFEIVISKSQKLKSK
jgi:hypothetical protein